MRCKWPQLSDAMLDAIEASPMSEATTNVEALWLLHRSHKNIPACVLAELKDVYIGAMADGSPQQVSTAAKDAKHMCGAWDSKMCRVPLAERERLIEFAEFCQGIMPNEQVVELFCSM